MFDTDLYSYHLPPELIARYPSRTRTSSRLVGVQSQSSVFTHQHFSDLPYLLHPHDLLVFNHSKVIPARLFGQKETGGHIEVLLERFLTEETALVHIRASKAPKPGMKLRLEEAFDVCVEEKVADLYRVSSPEKLLPLFERYGHIPLPPYIDRDVEETDPIRYQTVYAKIPGSVAAPTAGLHFDETLLKKIESMGVQTAYLTLHVGSGTFQPVRVSDFREHPMHAEWIEVSETVCQKIQETRQQGGRVIAVGTTVARALETASSSEGIHPYTGETRIFIYPGFSFQTVDAMVTNFHLPCSTLLMLVAALVGRETILKAYQEAIDMKYRFYSYGDAMFLER